MPNPKNDDPVIDIRSGPRWILLSLWLEKTGYTDNAFHSKRRRGIWLQDIHWTRAPDGHIMVDWRALDQWVEADRESSHAATASG